jgi:hypothetical protein
MSEKRSSNSPLNVIGTLVGVASGWTFSQYCGSSVWIPGATCLLLLLLFGKTPFKPKHFAGAIATTAGHLVWFLVGALISHNWAATGLDIAALLVGVVWLWMRPGLGSVGYLAGIQLLSLALNGASLASASFGSSAHRALSASGSHGPCYFPNPSSDLPRGGLSADEKERAEQDTTANGPSAHDSPLSFTERRASQERRVKDNVPYLAQ